MSTPREKAVFCEALEITDPEQRRQFLDEACGSDKSLRQHVERLLALSQSAGDFFKECAPALEPLAADAQQILIDRNDALAKAVVDFQPGIHWSAINISGFHRPLRVRRRPVPVREE